MTKLKQVVLALSMLPLTTSFKLLSDDGGTAVSYYSGSLSEAQNWATEQGRYSIAFFHAKWCTPCRVMEENTLRNPALVDYINRNYVATHIDIEQFDGVQARQDNQIKLLPTVIVYNPEGRAVARYESGMSSAQLLTELKRIVPPSASSSSGLRTARAPSKTYSISDEYGAPTSDAAIADAPPFMISYKPMSGYGVQLGCYSIKEFAAANAKDVKHRFRSEKVSLFVSRHRDEDRYFIVIGVYKTREEADAKKIDLKTQGVDCFVKDLSTIEKSMRK